jgi:microcystin-dependent protein
MPLFSNHSTLESQVGLISICPFQNVPKGWLECNGAALSRVIYADLFAVLGTTYAAKGDASTIFRLPDLRGKFVRGWDNGRGLDPDRKFGSYQADQFKRHSHRTTFKLMDDSNRNGHEGLVDGDNFYVRRGVNSSSVGGSETRPKNDALIYVIKY